MSPSSLSTLSLTLSLLFATTSATIVPVAAPPAFKGAQSGIGSWYQADSSRDSTNGKSWCGFSYTDSDPLFAPSLKLMGGATYSSDPTAWKEQTAKYCGLEAKVTDPATGKTELMYIGDSFAQPRSDGSIDIMLGGFKSLNGDPQGNKDTVIKNVQWELTGRQNSQYMPAGTQPVASGGSDQGDGGNDGQTTVSGSGAGAGASQTASPTTLRTVTSKSSKHHKTPAPTAKGQDADEGDSSCDDDDA